MSVISGEFFCPDCHARLRIQQSGLAEKDFPCPECETPLNIHTDHDGNVSVSRSEAKSETGHGHLPPRRIRALVALGVLSLLLVTLITWLIRKDLTPDPQPEIVAGSSDPAAPATTTDPIPVGPNDVTVVKAVTFSDRLTTLGQRTNDFIAREKAFPPAIALDDATGNGLSWLSQIAPHLNPGSTTPDWSQSWNHINNDSFVRRPVQEFLNPNIKTVAGDDRYPTTHVVGIAGVGADGPTLPVDHPRAGIFGIGRITRVKDVKDGLSNTWMASGVTKEFHSWANGQTSIRPLTQQPYVNGPDGFGSGDPNQMVILMADGSVRTVSKDIEPRILEQIATIAGDSRPEPVPPENAGPEAGTSMTPPPSTTSEPPVPVPTSKPMTPIDPEEQRKAVEEKLSQKIESFELNQPTPLQTILAELEAISSVPIHFDSEQFSAHDPLRLTLATLSGRQQSIGELLTRLLNPKSLEWTIEADHVLIQKSKLNP